MASCPEFFYPHSCHTHTYTIPRVTCPFLLPRSWSSCVGGANGREQCTWTSRIWSQIPPLALALCQLFHTTSSSFSSSNFTPIVQGVSG